MTLPYPTLARNAQRGSRPRCVLFTEGSDAVVAERLARLVEPFGEIDADCHVWMPGGFGQPTEAKLGTAVRLLLSEHREKLTAWWLEVRKGANTPNWDIASTATIDGREGLVLVEAKAHSREFTTKGQGAGNEQNRQRIRTAVGEADRALKELGGEWGLSCDSNFQLANRFAWSWKLASLGIPVVLVYLGFLNADEMRDRGEPFRTGDEWERAVRDNATGMVPEKAWEHPLDVGGTPLIPLIRSLELPLATTSLP
ncbi:hypothetical protein BH23GEM4_BH23GEM4_18390 [soil metagenome]